MHPDGFCCCLQASCQWQLRLRWRPKIFVWFVCFSFGATMGTDFCETRGGKSRVFPLGSSTNQGRALVDRFSVLQIVIKDLGGPRLAPDWPQIGP